MGQAETKLPCCCYNRDAEASGLTPRLIDAVGRHLGPPGSRGGLRMEPKPRRTPDVPRLPLSGLSSASQEASSGRLAVINEAFETFDRADAKPAFVAEEEDEPTPPHMEFKVFSDLKVTVDDEEDFHDETPTDRIDSMAEFTVNDENAGDITNKGTQQAPPKAVLGDITNSRPGLGHSGDRILADKDQMIVEKDVTHPSVGSAKHADGTCKRCCFFSKNRCANGASCEWCHYEHEKRKRNKRKNKGAKGAEDGENDEGEEDAAMTLSEEALAMPVSPSEGPSTVTSTSCTYLSFGVSLPPTPDAMAGTGPAATQESMASGLGQHAYNTDRSQTSYLSAHTSFAGALAEEMNFASAGSVYQDAHAWNEGFSASTGMHLLSTVPQTQQPSSAYAHDEWAQWQCMNGEQQPQQWAMDGSWYDGSQQQMYWDQSAAMSEAEGAMYQIQGCTEGMMQQGSAPGSYLGGLCAPTHMAPCLPPGVEVAVDMKPPPMIPDPSGMGVHSGHRHGRGGMLQRPMTMSR
mmetsp:Transcript_114991/g.245577  ORF Transcript_114991/g.245577 Transcript_114991/m.245577 type:complete len:518 (+) Transcript_114991:60-1613(+)